MARGRVLQPFFSHSPPFLMAAFESSSGESMPIWGSQTVSVTRRETEKEELKLLVLARSLQVP